MEKINNIKIDVLKTKQDKKINLHKDMFDTYFGNIFISSKKNSGKSNLIFNILKYIIVPKRLNKIFFFTKTFDNDLTYQAMKEKLEKYKINYEVYDDIKCIDENTGKFKNKIDDIINEMKEGLEIDKDKYNKSKYSYPLYIVVFDDISDCLKNGKSVEAFLKKNRHYRTITIISSQRFLDLAPGARSNINYLILFKNIPLKELEYIYDTYFNNISFERFLEIYNDSVKENYSFMFINTDNTNDLRKNFNFKYLL